MKTITIILLSLCCATTPLRGEQKVSFQELSSTANECQIEIFGFLYKTEDGTVILASQPNLKSCCIGASHKTKEQIVIEDLNQFPDTKQAIALRGTFHVDPQTARYMLRETAIVPKKNHFHLWIIAAAAGLATIFFLLKKRS